jgi:hypothetical protein
MGKIMHLIYGGALLALAVQAFGLFSFIPEGFTEYLVILVGVLMALTPLESGKMKRARMLQGISGTKLLGVPTAWLFRIFGLAIILLGVSSTFGIEQLGTYNIYTLVGKWTLVGIGAIYILSTMKQGTYQVGSF